MKPLETTLIEPAAGTPEGPRVNHKQKSADGRKKGPGGLTGDARKLSQGAAALEQRIRLVEERNRRAYERIWIILRLASGGMIFPVLRDSRLINDEDRKWLVDETGAPRNLITKGDS